MKDKVQRLTSWYLQNKRKLPWRQNRDPYLIWISEVMLQQTTVVTVIPYYEKFITQFPTVQKLSSAPIEKVLEYWSGLGYYSRARNLHKSAQLIAENGFPTSYQALMQLPGFGPYTSRAVSSIAFDESTGVLDGNVIRVLSRNFGLKSKWWENKVRVQFQNLVDQIVAHGKASIINQALMELGATVCTPEKPLCSLCPWNKDCFAFANDQTKLLPLKRPRKPITLWSFTPHLVEFKNEILLVKDPEFPFLKKYWFLPGELKKISIKPSHYRFKHSITNNYIYIQDPERFSHKIYSDVDKKNKLWTNKKSISKHSPSSMTKKVLELLE
ncbi:MAG: A/G-specific adenine glycosylase [Deltaproteobacteria bacterium]|jgi:A/G-specific adenine glycosylase|nr:A/G-specific adenine glycosylase [Deltaproteobacteria bacterium]